MLGPLVLAHGLLHLLAQTPSPSASSTGVADSGPVFSSLWVDLTAAAGFGAVGGVGYGLIQTKGLQMPRLYKDDAGQKVMFLDLGFIASILVGAIAALITYSLNPPASIARLVGLTLVAGVGGTAILKGYLSGQAAQSEADHSQNLAALAKKAATDKDTTMLQELVDDAEASHAKTRARLGIV